MSELIFEYDKERLRIGRGKFILLHAADRMNIRAANALLKFLEEPEGDSYSNFINGFLSSHSFQPFSRVVSVFHFFHHHVK